MSKKAWVAVLFLTCWLGVAGAESHAVDVMKDVHKAEHSVSKDMGKVDSNLKKTTHIPGTKVKKKNHWYNFHTPKWMHFHKPKF